MNKLYFLILAVIFLLAGCSEDSSNEPDITTIAAETWSVTIDNGTGSGIWELEMQSDSSLVISGSFFYENVTSPILSSDFALENGVFSFSASGTSNNPDAPDGYQNSDYQLEVTGNLGQGIGSGDFEISYSQTNWPEMIEGVWNGVLVEGSGITEEGSEDIFGLDIPEGFDFSLEKDVELFIELKTNTDEAISAIPYKIYFVNSNDEHSFIKTMQTDDNGEIETILQVPSYVENLFISGFMNSIELELINDRAEYIFGGIPERAGGEYTLPNANRDFSFLEGLTYNSNGVPDPVGSYPISAEMLERVNTSLPESVNLAVSHPQYLEQGITTNLVVEDSSDVWITFVTEGAGYRNALGFYSYDTAEGAPFSPEMLEHILIFPNASLAGEGGGLTPGMQIYLGRFGAGTTIGWFLVQNGWVTGSTVDQGAQRYYSDPQYNPENEDYQQHSVFLYDAESELFLLAFDDQERPFGDEDFNDAVFFATANPIENINTDNLPPIDIPVDSDDDGVNDPFDEYPVDPDRAFNVYYPSEDEFSSIVFEDKWPEYGDYDMNDLVIDYQYQLVTNADDEIVDVNGSFSLRGAGAAFNNGFSVILPFESSNLSLTGHSENISPDLVVDGNHTILDLFSNTTSLTGLSAGIYFNTEMDDAYYEPVDFNCSLQLTDPASIETLDFYFPFNPFLKKQGSTEIEIHLLDYPPSGRADLINFTTFDDASNLLTGSYYVSPLNLPWALNMPESWKYPSEKNTILEAYLQFASWAESGGVIYEDWYIINEGNADLEKIYTLP